MKRTLRYQSGKKTVERQINYIPVRYITAALITLFEVIAVIVGVIGALLLGVGLCCVLVWGGLLFFLLGIPVGVLGIALSVCAYPVYEYVTKKEREKIAPEILRLSEELLE